MATFIHGIGASENIDSSGEVVSIKGLDISSLDKDGVFNWEHKSDIPAQLVGKILKAKKIFSDADCEDDHQLAFWNKVKTPYLYVMGELFDDYSDSAREVAAKFRYDADHQNENNVMNFSVEGSKISKQGIVVTHSIARKITITPLACNKVAIAEMIAKDPKAPKKGDVDELFKSESLIEVEILTPKPGTDLWNLLKKEDPAKFASKLGLKKDQNIGASSNSSTSGTGGDGGVPTSSGGLLASEKNTGSQMNKAAPALSVVKDHQRGAKIGVTSSGQATHSHGMVGDYHGASAKDHHEHGENHRRMAEKLSTAGNSQLATHHSQKHALHMQAAKSAGKKAARTAAAPAKTPAAPAKESFGPSNKYSHSPDPKIKKNAATDDMNKALTAGSGMASPDALTGGAALAAEAIDGRVKKKSKLLQRAELEYTTWTKREAFESFMSARMPSLTRSEIQVIGQTMLLQKSIKKEKLMKDLYNPSVLKSQNPKK